MLRRISLQGILILGSLLFASIAQADKALVVGVNRYPNLKNADLDGCLNDSQRMGAVLEKRGFTVVRLANPKHEEIISALQALQTACKPDERFLFYFAGHGTKIANGNGVLLPTDAEDDKEDHYLTGQKLSEMVRGIPAKSRTVFLDACFSGAVRVKSIRKRGKTRYYRIKTRGEQPKEAPEQVNQADDNTNIVPDDAIACFAAASRTQVAEEDDFDGKPHGIFTYFLTQRLEKADNDSRWGEFQAAVSGDVSSHALPRTQNPVFSPTEHAQRPLFAGSGAVPPAQPKPKRTLWDDFNEDFKSMSRLRLRMTPNRKTVLVGENISFQIQIGKRGGYLVVLEKDTDDKVYLLHPLSGKVDDAEVKASTLYRSPFDKEQNWKASSSGTERVKALLFRSKQEAESFLSAFLRQPSDQDGVSLSDLKTRTRLTETVPPGAGTEWSNSFYTASLSFTVQTVEDANEEKQSPQEGG